MFEIRRLAREAVTVAGIVRVGTPPEVRRVGDVRQHRLVHRNTFRGRADDKGRAAGSRGVFERVAGPALGRVHADGQHIAPHARADDADAHHDRLAARLARELQVGRLHVGRRADRLGHDGGGGLDRVRVRLAAHPDRAQLLRVDLGAGQRVARGLDGHGERVFVQPGDRLLFDRQPAGAVGPHPGHFRGRQAITWDVGAVTDDADVTIRFQHGAVLLVFSRK